MYAGQPLVVVGVTGPVSIFAHTVYDLSTKFDFNFLRWMCWIGLWGGLINILLAIFNACSLVKYATRFSCEIFGCLIAVIYIWSAIEELVRQFRHYETETALLSLLLALGTFYFASVLAAAREWRVFRKQIRGIIADYGAAASVIIFTAIQFFQFLKVKDLPRLPVPHNFNTTSGRGWWINPFTAGAPEICSAILPGIVIAALFYFDHNVSSLLSQKPDFNLKKGSAFNWDYCVLGLTMIICAILGIPPTNGLIPQAPLHVRSLAKIKIGKLYSD
eukprot:TRINITY_DN4616_c0_g1_i1.p1 TRINITY_DN4616_c0_g1~~TRINITY_DN4616_c0_g1_i1.p1  ORF type:complete len:275 (-),score=30.83 TRINITY_DN4616_c0_g1_i1:80-904(-)